MDASYLDTILDKIADPVTRALVTDSTGRILAATQKERIGSRSKTAGYILNVGHAASIDNPSDAASDSIHFGVPVLFSGSTWGTVVVSGPNANACQLGTNLKNAIETALDYEAYSQQTRKRTDNEIQQIAQTMLSEQFDTEKLLRLMSRHEMDPAVMRTVICIRLDYYHNSYFNINLNLGYLSSVEALREEVARRLHKSRYLTSQDMIYHADRNTILVIKSFLPSNDLPRTYLALDVICGDFASILEGFTAFDYSLAYGNIYSDIHLLRKSWHEAEEIIAFGKQSRQKNHFYTMDSLLFESVCLQLHEQVVHKMIEPAVEKLKQQKTKLPASMIESCEAYVDSCMNLSDASAKTFTHRNTINQRIDRMKALTGLDPRSSFKDAFLIKMICTYLRLNDQV